MTIEMEGILFYTFFSWLLTTATCFQNRVVGAAIEDPTRYPFFAQLLIRRNNFVSFNRVCGASLVHPRCVLTAAHCVPSHPADKRELRKGLLGSVYMGSAKKLDRWHAVYTKITDFTIHPNYTFTKPSFDYTVTTNDIAICKLRQPYELKDEIQIIALAGRGLNPNVSGQILGIGEKRGHQSAFLTALSVDVQDQPHLELQYPTPFGLYSEHDMGYTGYPLEGDSGSPLIHTIKETETPVQFGVFTRMTKITANVAIAHYESVQHHLPFIEKAVEKLCGKVKIYGEKIKEKRAKALLKTNSEKVKSKSEGCCNTSMLVYYSMVLLVFM